MGIYDDISNILRTNPLTSISYAAGANVGKVVQNIPKINLPSTVSSLMPVVSAMAIPLAPAISGVRLVQNIPKINLPSTTLSLKPLASAATSLALPVAPAIASVRVAQNLPNIASSLSRGYENVNTAMSGITKQVMPSYQETGYMFNKLVADPTYGKLVKERTGLLPSEHWIATTSPGAMTTGGYTVVQKTADGSETRTKYGFKTDGSVASNVMQGITGFAEGGWNMPRERPLDTALILATGGVGEIAAGTSLGAKVLASPAARYGLIAGVGLYGGDVASRVAGVGDATADKSIYGMAKRLGGITTTEIAPGSVSVSGLAKKISGAIETRNVANKLINRRNIGNIRISTTEREIIGKMKPGSPEYQTAHSKSKSVGWVKGDIGEVPSERMITFEGVRDGKGGIIPETSFIGTDLTDIDMTHTHPVNLFMFPEDTKSRVMVKSTPIPSGSDLKGYSSIFSPSTSKIASRLNPQTSYITVLHGIQDPFSKSGGAYREVRLPFVSGNIKTTHLGVDVEQPHIDIGGLRKNKILDSMLNRVETFFGSTYTSLNRNLIDDIDDEIIRRRNIVMGYDVDSGQIHKQIMSGKYPEKSSQLLEYVNRENMYAQAMADRLRIAVRKLGGDVTFHKLNLKTGEQQIVDYPVVATTTTYYPGLKEELGYKSGYYLPPPTPITPVVYNQPATSISEVKQLIESKMPTLKDGYTRLYRVDPVSQSATGSSKPPSWLSEHSDTYAGRWFSDDLGNALWYWNQRASGDLDIPKLSYVDVPTKDVSAYKVSNIPKSKVEDASMFMDNPTAFSLNPTQEFYIPKVLAQQKEPILTATKRLDNIGLIFPEGNYPGPRKQRYNRKKKLVKTIKKSKTTKKRLIPQKKKPHLIAPKKKQSRSKRHTSLSTGTKIEKQMSKNVNRFLGW